MIPSLVIQMSHESEVFRQRPLVNNTMSYAGYVKGSHRLSPLAFCRRRNQKRMKRKRSPDLRAVGGWRMAGLV